MKTQTEFKNRLGRPFKNLLTKQTGVLLLCLTAANGPAQTYTILHAFTGGADGGYLGNVRLELSGTTLYGTTVGGGSNGNGTVFKLNTDGSGYTVLKDFAGNDGSGPWGSVVLSGSTLYGTTQQGGGFNQGTVFKLNTDGSGYVVLKNFTGSDGRSPCGGLLLSNATLYGTTWGGGDFGGGTVFKIGIDGTGYALLKSFNASLSEGRAPIAGLVLSDNTLYGTTSDGNSCGGSVFRVNQDGSGFMVLKSFPVSSGAQGIDGIWPVSPLVVSGNTLYGTADWGGNFGMGTLFRLNTDGTGFNVLRHFTGGSDGAGIEAGLLLSGTSLYGTAYEGGDHPYTEGYGDGTVFRINTDGSGFIVLKQFNGYDGGAPRAGLVSSGTSLFGTTCGGGSFGEGVLFSISVAPPTIQSGPVSQTAELTTDVELFAEVIVSLPMNYQWFFNGTNAIGGAANSRLNLTNVQFADSGAYTLVVTNSLGSVTSTPAMISVIPPVMRRPVSGIKLLGHTGSPLRVEYSDALCPASWLLLDTVTLASPPGWCFDLATPLPPQRFYRAWQSGTPGVIPSLDLHMVPAITLTGAVSSKVRVDGINQFGPIDAWFTLATVTLTNTSQLYFDVSVIGQPQRLYRLVPMP